MKTMRPFNTLSEAIQWWKDNAFKKRISVLVDFTDVNMGIQKREAIKMKGGDWVMGFSNDTRVDMMVVKRGY